MASVSVIIPTCNRCEALSRTLASLQAADFAGVEAEILVVDNASSDWTREAVEAARRRNASPLIRYFREPMPGLLSGRHRGAKESSADVCAYLDDDVRVGRDWPHAVVESFSNPAVALVGGPSAPLDEEPPPGWLTPFQGENEHGRFCGWLSLFDGGTRTKEIDPCFVWGLNFSIRRKVLFDLGGFHPDCIPKHLQRYQGDGETGLSLKIAASGMKAIYDPLASVEHEIPASRLTVEYFVQRAFYQGVCDSYTRIRAEGEVVQASGSWKDSFRVIKRSLVEAVRRDRSELGEVRARTGKAYRAGYRFHQDEVRRDPKLLEWVLRKDYWDYRLPDGWERWASQAVAQDNTRREKECVTYD